MFSAPPGQNNKATLSYQDKKDRRQAAGQAASQIKSPTKTAKNNSANVATIPPMAASDLGLRLGVSDFSSCSTNSDLIFEK